MHEQGASEHQKREAIPFVAWFGQQSEKKRRSALEDYDTLVIAHSGHYCLVLQCCDTELEADAIADLASLSRPHHSINHILEIIV